MKRGFHRSSCLQVDELTGFRRFVLAQDKAVKLYPMLNLPGLSEIDNLRCRSS